MKRTEYENPIKLRYKNVIPKYTLSDDQKTAAQPEFEDLPTTVKRMNEGFKKEPLKGIFPQTKH